MHVVLCRPMLTLVSAQASSSWLPVIIGMSKVVQLSVCNSFRGAPTIARTLILRDALATGADWLLWYDDDCFAPRDLWDKLSAHIGSADIIVPWCTTRREPVIGLAYKNETDTVPMARGMEPETIAKGAFHCVLMSRDAALKVVEASEGSPFRTLATMDGRNVTEDIWFFYYAGLAGLKTIIDPRIAVQHAGEMIYG